MRNSWDKIAHLRFGMGSGNYFCNEKKHGMSIFNSMNKTSSFRFCSSDVVLDIACGTGTYHCHISNIVDKLIGIDSSKEAIKASRITHKYKNNFYYEIDVLDQTSLSLVLEKYKPNKIIINSLIHYLDDSQILRIIKQITRNQFVKTIFIGDVPIKEKKKDLKTSLFRGFKFFLIKLITSFFIKDYLIDIQARDFSRKNIEKLLELDDFSLLWIDQDQDQQFFNSREGIVIHRDDDI